MTHLLMCLSSGNSGVHFFSPITICTEKLIATLGAMSDNVFPQCVCLLDSILTITVAVVVYVVYLEHSLVGIISALCTLSTENIYCSLSQFVRKIITPKPTSFPDFFLCSSWWPSSSLPVSCHGLCPDFFTVKQPVLSIMLQVRGPAHA